MQKFFIILALIFVALAILWPIISRLGLGNLPGDIVIKRGNFSFYFPIVTCLVVSLVLTLIFWLFNR